MESQNYQTSIVVGATSREAFEAICNVPKWWTQNVVGKSDQLNDIFTVRFGDTFKTSKITEIFPGKKIIWNVINSNLHWIERKIEWNGTDIIWEVSSANNQTKITMTHMGLTLESECFEECQKGWDFYIGQSLNKLLTEGKGLPEIYQNVHPEI
jgi:hypothetical protein